MDATAQATARHRISRDDGERVSLGGLDIIFKITGDQTGGALAICEIVVEPGRLIPAHLHDTEDEFTYLIEGRTGVLIEIITPAGFENFFREISGIFSADGPPDIERLTTTTSAPTSSSH
jgi:oxalate decarboxylase/phosphoglucose isomerase-like protein (cupin superfamily)